MHIEQAVRDAGYALRVINTPDGDPEDIAGALEALLEQGVDGLIVSEPVVKGEVPLRVDVPVLFVGAPPSFTATRTLTVSVGAHELARAATEHLLELGHDTVHHLAARGSGTPPRTASRDGGRHSPRGARTSRRCSTATGRPRPGTRRVARSPPTAP